MQIICNPAEMSAEQRAFVADVIVNYPGGTFGGIVRKVIEASPQLKTAAAALATIGADEPARLDAEMHAPGDAQQAFQIQPEQNAAAAFQIQPDPAAAFAQMPPAATGVVLPFTGGSLPTSPATDAPANPAISAPTSTTLGTAYSGTPAATVDKSGLPWDARIHADSKATNADGTWRKKRKLDDAFVAQVEAQLRQVMSAPAAIVPTSPANPAPVVTPAPVAAPVMPAPPVAAPVMPAPPVAAPVMPAPPVAAPVMPAPPVAAPVGEDPRQKYVALVGRASSAVTRGKVTAEEINACCVKHGVPALPLLMSRLDLLPQVMLEIDTLLAGRP